MSDRFTVTEYANPKRPKLHAMVQGYRQDGERVRRYFATKFQAQQEAARLNAEANRTGILGRLTDAQRVEAEQAFASCARVGRSLSDIVDLGLAEYERRQGSKTVGEAYDHMMHAKRDRSKVYLDEIRKSLRDFVGAFSTRSLATFTAGELATIIDSRPGVAKTRNNFRGYLCALWAHAVKYELTPDNPMKRTTKARETPGETAILTPEAMRAALDAVNRICKDSLAPIVIQAFAGLRTIEVARLDWREVNMEDGHITVTSANAKTRTRRNVDMADNLRAFLAPLARSSGPVMAACHPEEFPRIRALVMGQGHAWGANALRHSFVSYRLAYSGDEKTTALEAGHTVDMLHRHYKGLASKKAAAEWWAIRP